MVVSNIEVRVWVGIERIELYGKYMQSIYFTIKVIYWKKLDTKFYYEILNIFLIKNDLINN